jgi:hypothetical protein
VAAPSSVAPDAQIASCGSVGLFAIALSQAGVLARVDPIYPWHTPIAWTGLILLADAAVPILPEVKIFEMPIPGLGGFPPFAVECFTMYVAVRAMFCHAAPRGVGW